MQFDIAASQTRCVAPCGVHFAAAASRAPDGTRPLHDYAHEWDFGDPGARFDSLPDDFPFSRNANRAIGPFAGHVFAAPGAYTVALTLTDARGVAQSAFVSIDVRDPNEVFSGPRTIVFASDGDFAGAPPGAAQHTDFASAMRALDNLSSGRLLLKAGEVIETPDTVGIRDGEDFAIGKFGAGPNPAFDVNARRGGFRLHDVSNVSISSIAFVGDYDASTGLGEDYRAQGATLLGDVKNLTMWRTQHSGLGAGFAGVADGLVFADNVVTNWYDYGVQLLGFESARTAIVGNRVAQAENAVSGPGGRGATIPRWADHGPLRNGAPFNFALSQNDFFSNTGWSGGGEAHQPALRLNQQGVLNHSSNVAMNRLAGGAAVAVISVANADTITPEPGDTIFDRNVVIATDNSHTLLETAYGGTSVRQNLFVVPDVVTTTLEFRRFVRFNRQRMSSSENDRRPNVVRDNVMVNLQSRRTQPLSDIDVDESWAPNIVLMTENNAVYAPLAPNVEEFGPQSEAAITARAQELVGIDLQAVLAPLR